MACLLVLRGAVCNVFVLFSGFAEPQSERPHLRITGESLAKFSFARWHNYNRSFSWIRRHHTGIRSFLFGISTGLFCLRIKEQVKAVCNLFNCVCRPRRAEILSALTQGYREIPCEIFVCKLIVLFVLRFNHKNTKACTHLGFSDCLATYLAIEETQDQRSLQVSK